MINFARIVSLPQMRDRSFENQRYRASGLNLVTGCHHLMEHSLFGNKHQQAQRAWSAN